MPHWSATLLLQRIAAGRPFRADNQAAQPEWNDSLQMSPEELLTHTQRMWQGIVDGEYPDKTKGVIGALENYFFIELSRRRHSDSIGPDRWARWIDETAPIVERYLSRIAIDLSSVLFDHRVQWINDEWEAWRDLCWWLSTLTFLKEAYREEVDEDLLDQINLREVSDFLHGLGGELRMPEYMIPEGIPASHWWWWYPDE